MADRSKCPDCGAKVSPYAAGCAVCGADLDFKRWDSGPSVANRIGSALNAVSFGAIPGWVLMVVVLVALFLVFR
jgi:hypothetical protein